MKIIEWEFHPELVGKDNTAITTMQAGLTHNRDTDKVTGFYVQWLYKMRKDKEIVIRCLAESRHQVDDPINYTAEMITFALEFSLQRFIEVFQERLDLLDVQFGLPAFQLDESMGAQLLLEMIHKSE